MHFRCYPEVAAVNAFILHYTLMHSLPMAHSFIRLLLLLLCKSAMLYKSTQIVSTLEEIELLHDLRAVVEPCEMRCTHFDD